ncbi:hypothetical protein PIB30_085491 [Stylosanthes scabra]|uniref:Uncharacterized protein n=1 Tax=Stylosanthes scabra TaxID=79078 RepID=A0ABU6QTP7_9FABA|nr:hypothetical protein [Stylosanthes scabra]
MRKSEEDRGSGLESGFPTPDEASGFADGSVCLVGDDVKAVDNGRAVAEGDRTAGARCDDAVMEEHDSTTTAPEEHDATKLEPEGHYDEQMNLSWFDGDNLKAKAIGGAEAKGDSDNVKTTRLPAA